MRTSTSSSSATGAPDIEKSFYQQPKNPEPRSTRGHRAYNRPSVTFVRLTLASLLFVVGGSFPVTLHAEPSSASDAKKEAETRFFHGLSLFKAGDWEGALAEFSASRALHPTRTATKNAALSLRKLGRHVEALETFEELLRQFPDLPAEERELVAREIDELQTLVGVIEIRIDPDGAKVSLDGVEREATPLYRSIRVLPGRHDVHAEKEGFEPFREHVDVAAGQRVALRASLRAIAPSAVAPAPVIAPPPAARAPETDVSRGPILEIVLGAALSSTLGGLGDTACHDHCEESPVLGILFAARASYELRRAFSLGLEGGYLSGTQLSERGEARVSLRPGGDHYPAVLSVKRNLDGALIGPTAALRFGDRWPITLRFGAGLLLGVIQERRAGVHLLPNGDKLYPRTETLPAHQVYVSPEVRAGYRASKHFEASVGVRALVLFGVSNPRWMNTDQMLASTNPEAVYEYPRSPLLAQAIAFLAPSLGATYTF